MSSSLIFLVDLLILDPFRSPSPELRHPRNSEIVRPKRTSPFLRYLVPSQRWRAPNAPQGLNLVDAFTLSQYMSASSQPFHGSVLVVLDSPKLVRDAGLEHLHLREFLVWCVAGVVDSATRMVKDLLAGDT